jgi:hypothetical protein
MDDEDEGQPRGRLDGPRSKKALGPSTNQQEGDGLLEDRLPSYWELNPDLNLEEEARVKEEARLAGKTRHFASTAPSDRSTLSFERSQSRLSTASTPEQTTSGNLDAFASTSQNKGLSDGMDSPVSYSNTAPVGSAIQAVRSSKPSYEFKVDVNDKYESREVDTLRQVHTSSTSPLSPKRERGNYGKEVNRQEKHPEFQIDTEEIHFGDINRKARNSRYIALTNLGNVSARYRIAHPRGVPSLSQTASQGYSLRVIIPNPLLAPGITTKLEVEIVSNTREPKVIDDYIEIVTERRVFKLPVFANII